MEESHTDHINLKRTISSFSDSVPKRKKVEQIEDKQIPLYTLTDDTPSEDVTVLNNYKKKHSEICCNAECNYHDPKLESAPLCVLSYYGIVFKKKKKQKVCKICYDKALDHIKRLTYNLLNKKSVISVPFPSRPKTVIIGDDSEESSDEEIINDGVLSYVENNLSEVMTSVFKRCDIEKQLLEAERILTARVVKINDIGAGLDTTLSKLQKDVDEMRIKIYEPFPYGVQELNSVEIVDIGQINNYNSYLSANGGTNLKNCTLPTANNGANIIEQLSIVISDDEDCIVDDDVVFVDENVNKGECVSSVTSDSDGVLSTSILCSGKSEVEGTKHVTFGHVEEIVCIDNDKSISKEMSRESNVVSRKIQKIDHESHLHKLLTAPDQIMQSSEKVDRSVECQLSDIVENNNGCTKMSDKCGTKENLSIFASNAPNTESNATESEVDKIDFEKKMSANYASGTIISDNDTKVVQTTSEITCEENLRGNNCIDISNAEQLQKEIIQLEILLKLKKKEQKELNSHTLLSGEIETVENKSQIEIEVIGTTKMDGNTPDSNTNDKLPKDSKPVSLNYENIAIGNVISVKETMDTEFKTLKGTQKMDGNTPDSNTNDKPPKDSKPVNLNYENIAIGNVISVKETMDTEFKTQDSLGHLSGSYYNNNAHSNTDINKVSQDVVEVGEVKIAGKNLPPVGVIERTKPKIGDTVYVKKGGINGMWSRAVVTEICQHKTEGTLYKVNFERIRYCGQSKFVTGKDLAYSSPSSVRLPVGSRVVALFMDESGREFYYAGLVAEPPKYLNKFRYLIFFDDGYSQYLEHEKILLVYESSDNVWEDVHPNSRDFFKNYLLQYPERPMVKLSVGDAIKTEFNGKWWLARVLEVDGSLARMIFDADTHTEWIYRGSTRLMPLFKELTLSNARKILGPYNRFRCSTPKKTNVPYVEYTHSEADDIEIIKPKVVRAVARKSTSKPTFSEPSVVCVSTGVSKLFSRVINESSETYRAHFCNDDCSKEVHSNYELKGCNPLLIPMIFGWLRYILTSGSYKCITYKAPCGRRIRNIEELYRYLKITRSNIGIDMFDFDSWVNCVHEAPIDSYKISVQDISYGEEQVPVSLVNTIDHELPTDIAYTTQRIPIEGVNLNLDPEFLCGCDCTDNCEDRSTCSCWQLTLRGTAFGPEGEIDPHAGYNYKRLSEAIITGIYECNSRCKCSRSCLNRVVQFPMQCKLQIFKTQQRGWGIRCINDIPKGAFICIYAGNLLTEQQANEQGKKYGDEYLAELDYIEVAEAYKYGYESDVEEESDEEEEEDSNENTERGKPSHSDNNDKMKDSKSAVPSKATEDKNSSNHVLRSSKEDNKKCKGRDQRKNGTDKSSQRKGDDSDLNDSEEEDQEDVGRKPSAFSSIHDVQSDNVNSNDLPYTSTRTYFGQDEAVYVMDAKSIGNIGRYINHSCRPNVFVQNVFVDTHDLRFPWVAFFALSHITAGSELTWDYNYNVGGVEGKVLYCYCGEDNCRGRLL